MRSSHPRRHWVGVVVPPCLTISVSGPQEPLARQQRLFLPEAVTEGRWQRRSRAFVGSWRQDGRTVFHKSSRPSRLAPTSPHPLHQNNAEFEDSAWPWGFLKHILSSLKVLFDTDTNFSGPLDFYGCWMPGNLVCSIRRWLGCQPLSYSNTLCAFALWNKLKLSVNDRPMRHRISPHFIERKRPPFELAQEGIICLEHFNGVAKHFNQIVQRFDYHGFSLMNVQKQCKWFCASIESLDDSSCVVHFKSTRGMQQGERYAKPVWVSG